MRYFVRVFYEGAGYFGYQRQSNVSTIEETLIDVLEKTDHIISPKKNHFISASRTDKGVNAIGNVIGFNSEKEIILDQINAKLPSDNSIVCWAHSIVEDNLSPKHSLKKKYWYLAKKELFEDKQEINIQEIQRLCSVFEGKHDYKLFCKNDHRNTIREIEKITILEEENHLIFEFIAQSFLWEQVRRIVAYIANYWKLSEELQDTKKLLQENTSITDLNVKPANPENLILIEHFYEGLEWITSRKAMKIIKDKINITLRKIKQEEIRNKMVFRYIKEI